MPPDPFDNTVNLVATWRSRTGVRQCDPSNLRFNIPQRTSPVLDGRYGLLLGASQARQLGLGHALPEALNLNDGSELAGQSHNLMHESFNLRRIPCKTNCRFIP